MKKHPAEPPEIESGREKTFRRQDPVSCQFCRRKKLKCDRGAPCSNCKARRLTCSSAIDGHAIVTHRPSESPSSGGASNQSIDELNARVKRLEELLNRKSDLDKISFPRAPVRSKSQPPTSYIKSDSPPDDLELTKTVSWIETDAFEHTPTAGDGQSILDAKVTEGFGSFVFSLTRPRMAPTFSQNVATMLPTRSQGEGLLYYYFTHINWIYQIIHVPTVRKQFDCLYVNIEMGMISDYGSLALISTIYALSAYFSTPTSGLYFKHSDAMLYSRRWILLAQEALSVTNCLATPTVETLQSLILISQHMMANIGAIATLRTLSATIMHTARAMSLHQLDSPKNKRRRENTQVDYVDLEVKRRIWWHIAATDWLLSFMSGAQCGTYIIHPKQMNVDYPTNTNDEDINSAGPEAYAQPCVVPTEMTYSLFRLRFSIIFREMVDAAWEDGSDMDELPYELVLEFDKRLNGLAIDFEKAFTTITKNIPNFTSLALIDGKPLDHRSIDLARQRNMALFGMHTRFARLHRTYLVRGAQDPRYAYSRMVCLRSARTVIELGKIMTSSNEDVSSLKIWCINHHIFVSTVILVMDYCFNREEPRARERKEEILECFRMLEGSEEGSTIATRGLLKLKEMLYDGGGGRDNASSSRQAHPPAETSRPSAPTEVTPTKPHLTSPAAKVTTAPVPSSQFQFSASDSVPDSSYTQYQNVPFISDFTLHATSNTQVAGSVGMQNAWPDYDYLSYDNINFDANLDASQFEALLQGIDATAYS